MAGRAWIDISKWASDTQVSTLPLPAMTRCRRYEVNAFPGIEIQNVKAEGMPTFLETKYA